MRNCVKKPNYHGELDKYMSDLSRYQSLSLEQEKQLTEQIYLGDESQRIKLIQANLRFVVSIAHRYNAVNIPIEDLVNEGNIGLITAANLFNPTKGVKFITFSFHHIMGAILSSIYKNASLVRIPKHITRERKKIEQLLKYWEKPEEFHKIACAKFLNENPEDLLFLLKAGIMSPRYIDLAGDNDEFVDTNSSIDIAEKFRQDSDLKALIDRKLKFLSPKEEYVLRAYFDLLAPQKYTYLQLAKELGMTKEGIRLLKNRALIKLRKLISIEEFLEFL